MKYFYDTEFLEDGKTIDLISIAIVAEDGREFYAVNLDADWARIKNDSWLMENVVKQLPQPNVVPWLSKEKIADRVRDFLLYDYDREGEPELWADYAAYDHVALCQLWGKMIDLPDGMPYFTNEFRTYMSLRGNPELPEQEEGVHDALADAHHLKKMFKLIDDPYLVDSDGTIVKLKFEENHHDNYNTNF